MALNPFAEIMTIPNWPCVFFTQNTRRQGLQTTLVSFWNRRGLQLLSGSNTTEFAEVGDSIMCIVQTRYLCSMSELLE